MKYHIMVVFAVLAGCGGGDGSDAPLEPPREYTKIAANGDVLDDASETWSCVRDDETGLIWEVKQTGFQHRSADWSYSWYDSSETAGRQGYPDQADNCYYPDRCDTESFIADVNTTGLCGYTDWRLPNVIELGSLIWRPVIINGSYDTSRYGPPIDTDYFPNASIGGYWTATTIVSEPDRAFIWYFGVNPSGREYGKLFTNKVRLVRGDELMMGPFTVTIIAEAGGVVSYAGTDCDENTCMVDVDTGDSVVLTATPHYPYVFTGWVNCPSVDENVCTVPGKEDITVTAEFEPL